MTPTCELRFVKRFVPLEGTSGVGQDRMILQQKWASVRMSDISDLEYTWIDVPVEAE